MAGSHVETRDVLLQQRTKKELDIVRNELEKLRSSHRAVLSQLFDANHRGHQLANALGFSDIYQAQAVVGTPESHREITYQAAMERAEEWERELKDAKEENQSLKAEMKVIEQERDDLERQLKTQSNGVPKGNPPITNEVPIPSTPSSKRTQLELSALQSRYDALLEVQQRAAEKFKTHYAKWRAFKEWLFDEDAYNKDRNKNGKDGDTPKEKEAQKRRQNARVLRKRGMLLEMGPDLIFKKEENKENIMDLCGAEESGTPAKKKRRIDMDTLLPTSSPSHELPPSTTRIQASTNTRQQTPLSPAPVPPVSPSVHDTTPPARNTPVPSTMQSNKAGASRITPSKGRVSDRVIRKEKIPCSSDTEDDSQAPDPVFPILSPLKSSKQPLNSVPPNAGIPESNRDDNPGVQSYSTTLNAQIKTGTNPTTEKKPQAPVKSKLMPPPNTPFASGRADQLKDENRRPGQTPKNEEDGKREQTNAVPLQTPGPNAGASSKRLADYSAYKGRGRYAKDASAAKNTINARFAIDPARNEGCDFPFEEVVRGKKERRKMDAGDCECCADYYEAVGPLPKRLQPPLWRSPSSSPSKRCQHTKTTAEEAEAEERQRHKQQVSRHRHRWERASTPPSYWSIGFPNTQEVQDINERAMMMHRAKMEKVEGQVRRGEGKYKRRAD